MSLSVLLVSLFTFVQFNCENLFDCQHDSLKNDVEFLPDGSYHWTPFRYWRKLNRVGQTIVSCGDRVGGAGTQTAEDFSVTEESVASWRLPDMVALCEVENDSVMRDLTKRSLLRTARYEYVVTDSPDARGIDVALMYSPFSFRLLNSRAVRITPVRDMSPTRDLLYASGVVMSGDTLHVIVAHLPSRRGGEQLSRPFRRVVAEKIRAVADSVRAVAAAAKIIVAGDFNDYAKSESVRLVCADGFTDVSAEAVGRTAPALHISIMASGAVSTISLSARVFCRRCAPAVFTMQGFCSPTTRSMAVCSHAATISVRGGSTVSATICLLSQSSP